MAKATTPCFPPRKKRSSSSPIFHIEDVYVTGILAGRAGIVPRGHPGFRGDKGPRKEACLYSQARTIRTLYLVCL